MDHTQSTNGRVLRPEASTLSDVSMESSSTFVPPPSPPSPPTSIHHRPSYQRVSTLQEQDISYVRNMNEDTGLGIDNVRGATQGPTIEVSYSEEGSPAVPGSAGLLLSPSLSRSSKKIYRALSDTPEEETEAAFYPGGRARSESLYQPFTADPEIEELRKARRSSRSTLSPYGPTGTSFYHCSKAVTRDLRADRRNCQLWLHLALMCSMLIFWRLHIRCAVILAQSADTHFLQAESIQSSHAQPNSTFTTVAVIYPQSLF